MRNLIDLVETSNETVEEGIDDWKRAAAGIGAAISLGLTPTTASDTPYEEPIPADAYDHIPNRMSDDGFGGPLDVERARERAAADEPMDSISPDETFEPASAPELLNDEEVSLRESYDAFVCSEEFFGEAVLDEEKKTLT